MVWVHVYYTYHNEHVYVLQCGAQICHCTGHMCHGLGCVHVMVLYTCQHVHMCHCMRCINVTALHIQVWMHMYQDGGVHVLRHELCAVHVTVA